MRWASCICLIASLGAAPSLYGQESKVQKPAVDAPSQERIDALIAKLGSRNFAIRAKAEAELEKLGEKALDALRKAVDSKDLETSRRAKQIVAKIESETMSDDFLAAKAFHLNLENVTVKQAVRELQIKSGYEIQLNETDDKALQKKISLKLGNTTFWQAFDALCSEAGLVREQAKVNRSNIRPAIQPIFPNIQIPNIQPIPNIKKIQIPKIKRIPKIQPVPIPVRPAIPNALQVQVQKAQAIQIQGGRLVFPNGNTQNADPTIRVKPGTPAKYPTYYAGSVRIRLVPPSRAPKHLIPEMREDEILLVFEVMGEPRLKEFGVEGTPTLTKAIDDQGQQLLLAPEAKQKVNNNGAVINGNRVFITSNRNNANQRANYAVLRLKRGDKNAKKLKTLQGSLTVGALGKSKELLAIADVMKASGKTAKGNDGATMQVQSIEQKNGNYEIVVKMEKTLPVNNFGGIVIRGGNVQIQGRIIINNNGQVQIIGGGNSASKDLPVLVDKKGAPLQLVNIPRQQSSIRNNHQSRTVTMVFRGAPGQEPARLVLTGTTRQTVSAPFTFRDVLVR